MFERNNIETRLFLSKMLQVSGMLRGKVSISFKTGGVTCNYIPTETN